MRFSNIIDINKIHYPTNMLGVGKNKLYFIRTYGCQSNVRDSEIIAGILETMGFKSSSTPENADIIILNTCAIRENAEKKVFGEIGFLKQIKVSRPDVIFGVCGCMIQEKHVVEKIKSMFDHVELMFGTHNIHRLPQLLENVMFEKQTSFEIWNSARGIVESLPSVRNSKIKAFVHIMYGCDNHCTYCIVPTTRGKQISRTKESILKEVNSLIAEGYQEVTLLGQNVNSWGLDLNPKDNFASLLESVALTNIPRLRFTTSNPWDFHDDIIFVSKKYKNIMPYFHLPVQSGDDYILSEMNRNHDIEFYLTLFNKIKNTIPEASFSTDIIVGFPNESEEQFQNTLKLFHECKYANAYTFVYSPRKDTHAATLLDNIDEKTKSRRLAELNELVHLYAKEDCKRFVGKTLKVLVEGPSSKNPEVFMGYSEQNKIVNFVPKSKNIIGKIIDVKILEAKIFTLNGLEV